MPSAERLRRVFQHGYTMLAPEFQDGGHVRALTEEVYGHDRLDVRRVPQRFREQRHVQVVSRRIDIHENGPCAEPGHTTRRGEEGVGRRNHGVTRADPEGHQEQKLRIRAAGAPDSVRHAAIAGHGFFKSLRARPKDQGLRIRNLLKSSEKLGLERRVLTAEIEKRNGHSRKPSEEGRGSVQREITPCNRSAWGRIMNCRWRTAALHPATPRIRWPSIPPQHRQRDALQRVCVNVG
jgi:hypothetical protein